MSLSVLPMFSSKSFIVSGLTFRSLIHFQFIFAYGVRKCSNFIILHVCSCSVFPAPFIEEAVFAALYILAYFVKNKIPIGTWFFSGLSILFHWSIFLFLCQYHSVLIIVALYYCLKSRNLIPLTPSQDCFDFFRVFCVSIQIVKILF